MFPSIFCLHSSGSPPISFKRKNERDKSRSKSPKTKKSELFFTCQLEAVDGDFDQLLLFTDGAWPIDSTEITVDIYLKGCSTKLCQLTKSSRCFLWSKDENKDGLTFPKNGERRLTLQASLQGSCKDSPLDDVLSSPIFNPLTEGEIMKKNNETTPEMDTASVLSSNKKTRSVVSQAPMTPTKAVKSDDTVTTDKTPTFININSKSKKRQSDKENSCVTPKLKAARRSGPRANCNEKSPVKQKTESSVVNTHSLAKAIRCVPLPARVTRPSCRWGHSLCMVDEKTAVLIGGQGNKMQLSKDSVWALDTDCRSWKSIDVKTEGMKPECRTGHSATYDPTMRCIYVFGGSKNSKWFHDVHMFDLDEQKWSLVKANGKAPTLAYHTATLYRHELWMFGGIFPRPDPQPDGSDNELYIFSPVMEGWYKPIVTGEKPAPRSGHCATLVGDRMVVFGGWDFPFCYNDVNILDLTTVDWSAPTIQGEMPKPRCWSASCTLTDNRVFIQGGYDGDNPLDDAFILDLDANCWQKLVIDQGPSARAGHSCIRLNSSCEEKQEEEIIIFGGGDNDGNFFSDMLSFYVPYTPAVSDWN